MNFEIKSFDELTVDEMYEIAKSRFEVFVCEQKIIEEQDFDNTPHILFPYPQADTLIDLQSTQRSPCSDLYLNKKLLRS